MLKRGGRVTPYEERVLSQMDHKPISVALLQVSFGKISLKLTPQSTTPPETERNGEIAIPRLYLTTGTVEYSTTSAPPSYNGTGQSHQQVTL